MTSASDGHDLLWYYAEGSTRQGPVTTAVLLTVLQAGPDPRMVRVWREGMADWDRAGVQPELNPHLPPRVPSSSPRVTTESAMVLSGSRDADTIGVVAAPLNPWFSMWTKPRDTIRQITATDPDHLTTLLAGLAGLAAAVDRASSRNLGDKAPFAGVLVLLAVIGPISGIIGLQIGAVLIEWTGQRLGGRGDRAHIRAALAWGAVPSVWSLIPWVMVLLLMRGDTFTTETPFLDAHLGIALLALVPFLTIVIIAVWQPFVMCKAIGEAQGFSAWRALGNIVLASLVVGVPLLIVALVMAFALR